MTFDTERTITQLERQLAECQRENAKMRAEFGEVMDNLQAAVAEFDDGSHAGNNLDETIVELLRDAKAENAALKAENEALRSKLNTKQLSTRQFPDEVFMPDDYISFDEDEW